MNPASPANVATPTGVQRQGIQAGQAPAKPVSQYKLVGTSPPRIDIPEIVTGSERLHPERPRAGDAARARRASARPDGVRLRRADRLGRRELDHAHPERADRPQGRLPRRRRAAGVRRDPGGGAAEGQVGRSAGGACRAAATSSRGCGRSTAPARRVTSVRLADRANIGDVDAALPRRRTSSAGVRLADEHPHPDRAAVRGRRRDAAGRADLLGHAGRRTRRGRRSRSSSVCRENQVRVTAARWAVASATAPVLRHRPGGGADVPGRRRAGARAADALGRDRLGLDLAAVADGRPRRHRRQGQSRRDRLHATSIRSTGATPCRRPPSSTGTPLPTPAIDLGGN